jgi:hypothetical protein
VTTISAKILTNMGLDISESGVQFWSCNPFNGSGSIKLIHDGLGEEDGTELGYKSAGEIAMHIR